MDLVVKASDPSSSTSGLLGIGVTGHRPGGLKNVDWELLRGRIKGILALMGDVIVGGQRDSSNGVDRHLLTVRVISPLAEGADQIVAEEGLAAGYELYCPLPFKQELYEKDFSAPGSLSRFRHLLKKASSVNVIGGWSESEAGHDASYAAAGREVLRQSDILLAVWDGNPAKGAGGTAQIVEEARAASIPVVWVHSQTPHRVQILLPQSPWKNVSNQDVVEEWVRSLAAEEKKENPVVA